PPGRRGLRAVGDPGIDASPGDGDAADAARRPMGRPARRLLDRGGAGELRETHGQAPRDARDGRDPARRARHRLADRAGDPGRPAAHGARERFGAQGHGRHRERMGARRPRCARSPLSVPGRARGARADGRRAQPPHRGAHRRAASQPPAPFCGRRRPAHGRRRAAAGAPGATRLHGRPRAARRSLKNSPDRGHFVDATVLASQNAGSLDCTTLVGTRAAQVIDLILERASLGWNRSDSSRKLALVIEGGGMRGVISAGSLLALDLLGFRELFDEIYATSAGGVNAAYFLSGQGKLGMTVYFDDIANRRFINPWRLFKIVDVDYAYDRIVSLEKPLDDAAIRASPVRFLLSVTDARSGLNQLLDVRARPAPISLLLQASRARTVSYI